MASEKKKRKLKNSYCEYWALKAKGKNKLKRVFFFTPSERKRIKDEVVKISSEEKT